MNTISLQFFGYTPAGESVERILLDNGILSCSVITYGAILQSLTVPDRHGDATDIVLGFDTLDMYLSDGEYIGAIVGRFANRIAGGRFCLDGKEYTLATNAGVNHMHGGIRGYSHRVWTVESISSEHVTLTLFSPDGEEGFPGSLNVKVTYRLEGSALVIHYQAETDQATPCNLTNHSYFNLNGHDSSSIADQQLMIHASRYTPANGQCLVLGTVELTADTPMDFQTPTAIGDHIHDAFIQLRIAGGYDHNYVIDDYDGSLRPAAQAFSPRSGITMTVETTQPGIQFYTANSFPNCYGKSGAPYQAQSSFCLEAQGFPDAPNHPHFPNSILHPGEQYSHITRLEFSCHNRS